MAEGTGCPPLDSLLVCGHFGSVCPAYLHCFLLQSTNLHAQKPFGSFGVRVWMEYQCRS